MNKLYRCFFKRFIGCIGSALGLVILLIPMLIISLIIVLDSKGAPIYKQERLGKNRKPFYIYKFRTMVDKADKKGGTEVLENDPRITRVGAVLRKLSVDEFPQMINILKGDMCIIGPRPLPASECEEFADNAEYEKRFSVYPGMFCTVDVDLRATAEKECQLEMDAEYTEKISFWLDFKVFFLVFFNVIRRKNVYAEAEESSYNEVVK